MKNVDKLLKQAEDLVLAEIQKEVKKILLSPRNSATTFVCAMGGYCFYNVAGEPMDEKRWMDKINKLFDKYDSTFKLTGIGWRCDLIDGTVIKSYDW